MQRTLAYYVTNLRNHFVHYCNEELQAMGLSQGLLYFLLYVGKHPACSASELAIALQADAGHTTRSLDKLVQSGFILKEKSPTDRRTVVLQLTDHGQEAFEKAHTLFLQWDEQLLKGLSHEESTNLLQQLQNIIDHNIVHNTDQHRGDCHV